MHTMDQSVRSMKVRYPQEHDIGALASLAADVKKETGLFEKRHQLLYKEIEVSRSPGRFFLVIEYGGELAGFVRAVRSRSPMSNLWWIAGLEIKPSARRKGLGTFLTKEALYNIYHRGCSRVCLQVDKDNVPATALYRKLAFTRARGLLAGTIRLLHPGKEVLTLDLAENEDWINRPEKGYKYMGIR